MPKENRAAMNNLMIIIVVLNCISSISLGSLDYVFLNKIFFKLCKSTL